MAGACFPVFQGAQGLGQRPLGVTSIEPRPILPDPHRPKPSPCNYFCRGRGGVFKD